MPLLIPINFFSSLYDTLFFDFFFFKLIEKFKETLELWIKINLFLYFEIIGCLSSLDKVVEFYCKKQQTYKKNITVCRQRPDFQRKSTETNPKANEKYHYNLANNSYTL